MTWQDITVYQFQQLARLAGEELTPDNLVKTAAICFNITEQEVDSWPVSKFHEKVKELSFLQESMIWEPVQFVEVDGRRYRFVYDVRNIHAARYIDVKQLSREGFEASLHKCAASMVVPQVKTGKGWKDAEYDAAKHGDYAQDMLSAPITAIHGSALFFSKVYAHSIASLADSLKPEGLTPEQMTTARALLLDSPKYLAGSITPGSLPSVSVSHLSRRIASRQSNSLTIWPTSKRRVRMRKNSVKTENEHR